MASQKHKQNTGSATRIDPFALAEMLIAEQPQEAVIAALVAQGIAPAQARYEVERALKSPWLGVAARYAARAAKRDWVLDFPHRMAVTDNAPDVPRFDRLDPVSFFTDYYRPNRPCVLAGLIEDWPARTKWTLDYLARAIGDREVGIQWDREADPDYEVNCFDHAREMPFPAVLERLRAGASNDFYITANNAGINNSALAPLWADIGSIPGFLEPQLRRDGYFWMGPQGTVTPWHHDLSNNLLLQIMGRKRIRLVAAQDTHLMRNHRHCFTEWTADRLIPGPASEGKPAVYECVIGPGEGLFIPVGWWHHVEGLDISISLSFLNFAAPNDFQSNYRCFGAL